MLTPIFLAGFSGHRPSDETGRTDSDLEGRRVQIEAVFTELLGKCEKYSGRLEILCSISAGADTIACEVAISMRLPLHVVLPKPLDTYSDELKETSPCWWKRIERIISHVREGQNRSSLQVVEGSPRSPDCYVAANRKILEGSDFMVFLSDESAIQTKGGTNQFLAKVKSLNRPHYVVSTTSEALAASGIDEFFSSQVFLNGLQPFKDINTHLENFNPTSNLSTDKHLRHVLEDLAGNSSRWFRFGSTISVVFHGIATLVAAFIAANMNRFQDPSTPLFLTGIEFFLVSTALIIVSLHHRLHTQRIWLSCRMAREIIRGVDAYACILDPFSSAVHRVSDHWSRLALTVMLDTRSRCGHSADWEALREKYVRDRLLQQRDDYFRKKQGVASRGYDYMARFTRIIALLAVITVAISFSHKGLHWIHSDSTIAIIVYFLPIGLPLLAGMTASLSTFLDFGRRSMRYATMVQFLSDQEMQIRHADSLDELQETVRTVEEILFYEQLEWHTAAAIGHGH